MGKKGECDAPVRIAIRGEEEWINAYLTTAQGMDEAMLIATMRRAAGRAGGFDAFKVMCGAVARVMLEAALGPDCVIRVEERDAPEHERSGHG